MCLLRAAPKRVDLAWWAGRMRHMRSVRGHMSGVFMVAVDPSGRYFVTGSDDAVAKIWCAKTAVLQASCCAHLVRFCTVPGWHRGASCRGHVRR